MMPLHQTLRRLGRAPAFTLATVLTLAISLGATTAIFSVVNGILIEPLPFPDSDRLVALRHRSLGADDRAASPALYFTYREHNETFESVALWWPDLASVTGAGDPEEVQILAGTAELLPMLGVQPALGRDFNEAEHEQNGPNAVILGHGYWQRVLGGDAAALGRTLVVDGAPHEIVGVMPASFRFPDEAPALLLPARPNRALAFFPSTGERALARLKDDVTLAEASADVERMIPIVMEEFPLVPGLSRDVVDAMQFGPNLKSLREQVVGDLDDVLWVLMGTIGMLLLLACANVANLQLVRTESRSHELAIRAALGAGRARMARGLLLESVVLALAGGAAGVLLAALALPVLLAMAADDLPGLVDIGIDATVLAFAFGISLLTGLLFGLLPVLKHAGPRLAAVLNAAGRSASTSRDRHRARNALVVAQVALALVLLVAAGLMIRTFQSLRDVDAGITEPQRIQTLRLSFPQAFEPDFERVELMMHEIRDRMAGIAGVESAGFSSRLPIGSGGPDGPFTLEDAPDRAPVALQFRYTSQDLFATWGTPLVAGRDLTRADAEQGRQVAVVSESFARREWGSPRAALGKRLRRSPGSPWLEIVGVAGDVRHRGLERPAEDAIYIPLSEEFAQYAARFMVFFARSDRADTASFVAELERAVWSVDPNLPVAGVRSMAEIEASSIARTSLTLMLLAITASMALLLGLVGIYGVISHMLVQRTREIGIRLALGARFDGLKRMLLGQVLLLVAAGAAIGIGGAALLARLMDSLLFGVTAFDPATYAGVAILLVAAAALAGYVPARRITRIDPMRALREE